MQQVKFKVLVYLGQFVDESLLYKGIYTTDLPKLHDNAETIEGIIERWTPFKDSGITSNSASFTMFSDAAFENLKQCQLVDFSLVEKPLDFCWKDVDNMQSMMDYAKRKNL